MKRASKADAVYGMRCDGMGCLESLLRSEMQTLERLMFEELRGQQELDSEEHRLWVRVTVSITKRSARVLDQRKLPSKMRRS